MAKAIKLTNNRSAIGWLPSAGSGHLQRRSRSELRTLSTPQPPTVCELRIAPLRRDPVPETRLRAWRFLTGDLAPNSNRIRFDLEANSHRMRSGSRALYSASRAAWRAIRGRRVSLTQSPCCTADRSHERMNRSGEYFGECVVRAPAENRARELTADSCRPAQLPSATRSSK